MLHLLANAAKVRDFQFVSNDNQIYFHFLPL